MPVKEIWTLFYFSDKTLKSLSSTSTSLCPTKITLRRFIAKWEGACDEIEKTVCLWSVELK